MAAALMPTSSGTPAEQLEGLVLNNGWTVGKPIIRTSPQAGGCFPCAYHVPRANWETAFLKAMDFAAPLREPDRARALNELTGAFLFERAILEECADRKMSRIVRAIDGGITTTGGSGCWRRKQAGARREKPERTRGKSAYPYGVLLMEEFARKPQAHAVCEGSKAGQWVNAGSDKFGKQRWWNRAGCLARGRFLIAPRSRGACSGAIFSRN